MHEQGNLCSAHRGRLYTNLIKDSACNRVTIVLIGSPAYSRPAAPGPPAPIELCTRVKLLSPQKYATELEGDQYYFLFRM